MAAVAVAGALLAAFAGAAWSASGWPSPGGEASSSSPAEGVEWLFEFGTRGSTPGKFAAPRGIAVGPGDVIAVVDRSGRVQRFQADGTFLNEWALPKSDTGTPTGLGFDHDGTILVADTHNSRMLRYSPEGRELARWGRYGAGEADCFVYLTDACVLPRGAGSPLGEGGIYVSEYGREGHDRVLGFASDGRLLTAFGEFGELPGHFRRPMGICAVAGPGGTLLCVADSTNDRVQGFDAAGRFVREFGGRGSGPGRMVTPMDVAAGPDGTLYVVEYGNHRVQRFTAEGRPLGAAGSFGTGAEQFNYPWGVAVNSRGVVYVADTKNHRVVALRFR